jgi:hypothetical protein
VQAVSFHLRAMTAVEWQRVNSVCRPHVTDVRFTEPRPAARVHLRYAAHTEHRQAFL